MKATPFYLARLTGDELMGILRHLRTQGDKAPRFAAWLTKHLHDEIERRADNRYVAAGHERVPEVRTRSNVSVDGCVAASRFTTAELAQANVLANALSFGTTSEAAGELFDSLAMIFAVGVRRRHEGNEGGHDE